MAWHVEDRAAQDIIAGMGPTADRPREIEMTAPSADRATYLYCVVRIASRPRMARVPEGMPHGGRPTALEAAPSMWLIVSEVPLAKYGADPLESTLKDLDSVAALAVAHEAVVEYFARNSDASVVPMKMFTMFSSAELAVSEMRARRKNIKAVLDRVARSEEWGVRVTAKPPRVLRAPVQRPRTGTAFLTARKKTRDQLRAAARQSTEAATRVFKELSRFAKDSRQRHEVPPGAIAPLLDAAFLIPVRQRAEFRRAVNRLARTCAEAGADLTVTGPWPAYNFVQMSGD
jgi:hypothetical protein